MNDLPHLPHNRIRTIMKSSDQGALNIKDVSLQLVCRATEMFIQLLAKESHKASDKTSKTVEYKHLADYVQGESRLEFLHEIVPKKITVKEFREIMSKQKSHDNSSEDTTSSEEEDGDDDDDDEGENDEDDDEAENEEEEGEDEADGEEVDGADSSDAGTSSSKDLKNKSKNKTPKK